ncbi:hypothetical protein Mapa_004685 [Marchantia paleacea]|nr:hypothetical protein Mapa_004685 [Marchantia paleacea]
MRSSVGARRRPNDDDDFKKELRGKGTWTIVKALLLAFSVIIVLGASAAALNRLEIMGSLGGYEEAGSIGFNGGKKRAALYDRMGADLDEKGAAFLDGGETSQSLNLSDLFTLEDGIVTPVQKPANPPVRATVLHLSGHYALQISEAVKKILNPHFSGAIWYQDVSFYHFSLFHASHHIEAVPATEKEVQAEAEAAKQVAARCCPLEIVLDRVLLTSTGVLLGCWQVLNGTDPAIIRKELRHALVNAPNKQLYDPVILHTSIARILGPPKFSPSQGGSSTKEEALFFMKSLVRQINEKLSDFQAKIKDLWFVEELDLLALALKGRLVVHKYSLGCSSSGV